MIEKNMTRKDLQMKFNYIDLEFIETEDSKSRFNDRKKNRFGRNRKYFSNYRNWRCITPKDFMNKIKHIREKRRKLKPLIDSINESKHSIDRILSTKPMGKNNQNEDGLGSPKAFIEGRSLPKSKKFDILRGMKIEIKKEDLGKKPFIISGLRTPGPKYDPANKLPGAANIKSMSLGTSTDRVTFTTPKSKKHPKFIMRKGSRVGRSKKKKQLFTSLRDKKNFKSVDRSNTAIVNRSMPDVTSPRIAEFSNKVDGGGEGEDKRRYGVSSQKRKLKKRRMFRGGFRSRRFPELSTASRVLNQMRYIDVVSKHFEEVELQRELKKIDKSKDVLIIEADGVFIKRAYSHQDTKLRFLLWSTLIPILELLSAVTNMYIILDKNLPNYIKKAVFHKLSKVKVKGYLGSEMKKNRDYSDVAYRLNFKHERKTVVLKSLKLDFPSYLGEGFLSENATGFFGILDFMPLKTVFPKYTLLLKDFSFSVNMNDLKVGKGCLVPVKHSIDGLQASLLNFFQSSFRVASKIRKLTYWEVVVLEDAFAEERSLEIRSMFRQGSYFREKIDAKEDGVESKKYITNLKKRLESNGKLEEPDPELLRQFNSLVLKNLHNLSSVSTKWVKPFDQSKETLSFIKNKDMLFKAFSKQLRNTSIILI